MAFSILHAVLIRVKVEKDGTVNVIRSPSLSLFWQHDKEDGQDNDQSDDQDEDTDEENGDDNNGGQEDGGRQGEVDHKDDQDDNSRDEESGKPPYEHSNFIALMHFLNAAENQKVLGIKSSIFPNEVLLIIMHFSDGYTYHTLAKVSSYCRKVARTNFRLNNDYAAVGKGDRYCLLPLEDLQTGVKIKSSFSQEGLHVLSQLGLWILATTSLVIRNRVCVQ